MCFFFQAEDGIRDLVRSRGLGDVYKRQVVGFTANALLNAVAETKPVSGSAKWSGSEAHVAAAWRLGEGIPKS